LPAFERVYVITMNDNSRYLIFIYFLNRLARLGTQGLLRVTDHEIDLSSDRLCGLRVVAYEKISFGIKLNQRKRGARAHQ